MKTFTFAEVVEFAKAQPDERKLNLANPEYTSECGCIMQQFGIYKEVEFSCCSYEGDALTTYNEETGETEVNAQITELPDGFNAVTDYFRDKDTHCPPHTFGELKVILEQKGF